MKRKYIKALRALPAGERGQILVIVLVFMVLGSLVLGPLLSYLGTAFQAGGVYHDKTDRFYAADSGIEDALWQIKYAHLDSKFVDYNPPYDPYDFTTAWSYQLDEPVNEQDVGVTIQNVWMPTVTPTDLGITWQDAREGVESNKLIVTGTASSETTYKIKITFNPEEGEEDSLLVESIGIWLPLGFTYEGNSNILSYEPLQEYYPEVTVTEHDGGQAVVWNFGYLAPFIEFPGVDPDAFPLTTEVSFSYASTLEDVQPAAVAWMTTGGVPGVRISWDADTKIYRIAASAGRTDIETYAAKCELRKMGAAISGDYRAIGNSLMRDIYWDPWEIREQLLNESSTAISDIPGDAEVVAAYLYWSGWFANETWEAIWEDDCDDFANWDDGSSWSVENEHFKGHDDDGPELTLTADVPDLSDYEAGDVRVSWYQWEHGHLHGSDSLEFRFSGDGGGSWSSPYPAFSDDIGDDPVYFSYPVPADYLTDNFAFKFELGGFTGSGDNCYVDNFAISTAVREADTDATFKINGVQVYLDEQGDPQTGSGKINAAAWETLENNPGEYSYACHQDVTDLVRTYSSLGDNENHTGNGLYTVGDVDADTGGHWSYAGWSLIVIYSSPATAGHQLFLYDSFAWAQVSDNFDWDRDDEPGGTITGFIMPDQIPGEVNAATLTCFVAEGDDWLNGDQLVFNGTALSDGFGTGDVWNSKSIGMSEDGMDIDTFTVTWASSLLEPGDTTAQIDVPNPNDNWNLIYIILSFRSKTTTGGTSHYVVHGG